MKTKIDNRIPFKVTFKYDKFLWEYLLNEKTRESDPRFMYLAGTLLGIAIPKTKNADKWTAMDEVIMMHKDKSYRSMILEKLYALKKLDGTAAYVMFESEIGLIKKDAPCNKRYMKYFLSMTGKIRSDKTVMQQTWSSLRGTVLALGLPRKFGECSWGEFCFKENGPALPVLLNIAAMTSGETMIRTRIFKVLDYLSGNVYNYRYTDDDRILLRFYKYYPSFKSIPGSDIIDTIWRSWEAMNENLFDWEEKIPEDFHEYAVSKSSSEIKKEDDKDLLKSVAEEAKNLSSDQIQNDSKGHLLEDSNKKEIVDIIDIEISICNILRKRLDQLNNTKDELIKELKLIDDKRDRLYEALKILEK